MFGGGASRLGLQPGSFSPPTTTLPTTTIPHECMSHLCATALPLTCLLQNLEVPMEEDVLSDVVPSNIVSRQVGLVAKKSH